jgi:imidazolonepropionase-like amidohydrolase
MIAAATGAEHLSNRYAEGTMVVADPSRELIVTAQRLIDGTGRPPVIDAAVVIASGKIEAVGRQEELGSRLDGALRLDFDDATVLPGMIDCHTHLVLWGDARIPFASIQQEPDERLLLRAACNARLALESGVTTLADFGGRGTLTFALRDGIERGYVDGPRLILSGRPITATGGHCWYFGGEADGPDNLRCLVRELVKQGADIIKVMTTGGGTVGTDPYRAYFTLNELQCIVEEAHRAGKIAAAHCSGLSGLVMAIDAGFDVLVHATFVDLDGSYQFDEVTAERIVASGAFVNPTMHVTRARIWAYRQRQSSLSEQEKTALTRFESSYAVRVDYVRRLHQMGAKLVAGSDAGWGDYRFGDYYLELDAFTDAGLTPMNAIVAGTSRAAECLRVANRVGTVEPGKDADLLIVAGDPLVDLKALSNVVAVFQNGQRRAGASYAPALAAAQA